MWVDARGGEGETGTEVYRIERESETEEGMTSLTVVKSK